MEVLVSKEENVLKSNLTSLKSTLPLTLQCPMVQLVPRKTPEPSVHSVLEQLRE